MRRELRITTARALILTSLVSQLPIPSYALETGGYSSKALDRGVVVGVYDPYFKSLKLFHYWISRGKGYTDSYSNTECTLLGKVAEVGISTRKINCKSGWIKADKVKSVKKALSSSGVKVSPLVNDLYYCEASGQFGYKADDGYYLASLTLDDYSVCRRIVDPDFLNNRYNAKPPFDKGENGHSGGLRNVWFENVPFGGGKKGALDLLIAYSQASGANAGILAVEGLHFHKHKHKCGLFKKCIDYIWDEKVSYYEIARTPSPQYLQGGFYLSTQGIGNNLYVHSDRIKKITKKGWSFIAVVVAQVALVALTGGLGAPTMLTSLMAGGFLASDVVSGFQHGWGGGMYRFGEGITPGAFNDFGKDTEDSDDAGSKALHSRFISGSDLNTNALDGYEMAKRIYESYLKNWEPTSAYTMSVVKGVDLGKVKARQEITKIKESIARKVKERVENKAEKGFIDSQKEREKENWSDGFWGNNELF